jgi:hypothetical protein
MARNSSIETKVYDLEYFSGAQVNVYIGDVLIDEITGLQVQVQQRKLPIYGYASQLFDKVAKATVTVQGAFTINFKEAGYLHAVLERYKRLSSGNSAPVVNPFMSTSGFSQLDKNRSGGAKLDNQKGVLSRRNIEQMRKNVDDVVSGKVNGRDIKPEEYVEYYRSLSGFNNDSPARSGSVRGALNDAEDIFEAFEDKVWSVDRLDRDSEGRRGDSNRYDDFTIYITYGDFNRNDRVNHTAKRIDNVHLIDQSQTIMINGEPISEQYSFIARNYV